jgi:hypothetical protein
MNVNTSFSRGTVNTIEPKGEAVNSVNGYWMNGTWFAGSAGELTSGIDPNYGKLLGGSFGTNSLQATNWIPAKTAAGDFFKVQYAEVAVRCAITRKMVPAGSPVMLLGGMVISAEAFENWLEEHLAGMISRHQDLHTDNAGYDE